MKQNPFTTKAKSKKLKSFKAAAAKKPAQKETAKANGIASPFTRLAKIGSADPRIERLITLKGEIKDVAARLETARKNEAKLFKPVDKLALREQTNNDKYQTAYTTWNDAAILVDRLNARLMGLCAARQNLDGQISGRIQQATPKKARRK